MIVKSQMLFIPCVATVAVMKKETGNWRSTLLGFLLLLVIAVGKTWPSIGWVFL